MEPRAVPGWLRNAGSATCLVAPAGASSLSYASADVKLTGVNDHLAIIDALNILTALPTGGLLAFAEGVIVLGDKFDLKPKVSWRGYGRKQTEFRLKALFPDAISVGVFDWWGAGSYLEDVEFRDFSINGNRAAQNAGAIHPLLVVDYGRGVLIENVETFGAKNACGISFFHSSVSTGRPCRILHCPSHDNDRNGYDLTNAGLAANDGLHIVGGALFNNGWNGIICTGQRFQISGCMLVDNIQYGLAFDTVLDGRVDQVLAQGNGAPDGSGYADIYLVNSDRNILTGCRSIGSHGHGFYLLTSDRNKLLGCKARSSFWSGVVAHTSDYNEIDVEADTPLNNGLSVYRGSYNTLRGQAIAASMVGGLAGIKVEGDVTRNADYNKVVGATVQGGGGIGIHIVGGANANKNLVDGCQSTGNVGANLTDAGTGTVLGTNQLT